MSYVESLKQTVAPYTAKAHEKWENFQDFTKRMWAAVKELFTNFCTYVSEKYASLRGKNIVEEEGAPPSAATKGWFSWLTGR